MSAPGNPGYSAPREPIEKIVRRIQDLERTVAQMQTQLVNNGEIAVPAGGMITVMSGATLTISDGGSVTVVDGSGNTVATLGTVGGVTSVHAQNPASGASLPMSQLAFGMGAANDGGTNLTQTTLNTFQAGPMSISCQVHTDKMFVLVSGILISGSTAASQAMMSWNVAGPTNVGPAANRCLAATTTATAMVFGTEAASYGYLHTGLTPGSYTVTDRYQSTGSTGIFESRSMLVIPF